MKTWKTHKDEFNPNKPLKYIYPDQKKLKQKFIKFITPFLKKHKFFKKVWIWGSLSRGQFGIYETPYNEKHASDIDLLIEVNEKSQIPKELIEIKGWTKTRTYSRLFLSDLKFAHKLKSGKTITHTVDFICHWPNIHTKPGFYSKVEISELIYGSTSKP